MNVFCNLLIYVGKCYIYNNICTFDQEFNMILLCHCLDTPGYNFLTDKVIVPALTNLLPK